MIQMARLYPFRALRYNTSRVNMADVVTQPYDKISREMQDRYYAKSPYNLIRIVLGKREGGDSDGDNVYTRAADTFRSWREEGVLNEEAEPALYGYSQTYTVPGTGTVQERRGFIALGHLYDYADQVVFRHEQTFPKHKSDRLALFKALRAYPEQIYMLYSDPTFTAEHLIFEDTRGTPRPADLEFEDEYGFLHRVWKLTEPALIRKVLDTMADKKLIIADGHHRYETSVAYRQERAAELGFELEAGDHKDHAPAESDLLPTPPFPEAAMMMTFVNMDADGITILPTHRVVFGLKDFESKQFAANASKMFVVEQVASAQELESASAAKLLRLLNDVPKVAFVAATRDGAYLLTPRQDVAADSLKQLSPRQAQLDVVQLHKLVLEDLLGLDEAAVRTGDHVRYLREADEALREVAAGEANLALLIKPVTLAQMKDISLNLEVMPQKSTDFYPKLLSGLAMYALDEPV